jgi:type III secretion protein Q
MTAAAAHRTPEVPSWAPIADRLPKVTGNVARVSRLVCDERFQRWLSAVTDDPLMQVRMGRSRAPLLVLDIEANEGRVRVGLEPQAVTPAMRAALAVGDSAMGCRVLTMLLEPVWRRFQPVITGAQVVSWDHSDRAHTGFVLSVAGMQLALCGADARGTSHLSSFLGHVSADLSDWSGLCLQGRVRFMVRHWRAAFLASLRVGDVVLLGRAVYEQTLIIGIGQTLQVHTQMSTDTPTLHVADEPYMGSDAVSPPDAAGQGIEDLQLPVVFEVDTARISLAELAAMRPGYIVELDAPLSEATIRLVCQGQTVGHGQLIGVGEQLGVRITSTGTEHGLHPQR